MRLIWLLEWSLFGAQQSLACNNFSPSLERACFEYKSGTINPSLSPLNLNTLRPAQHKRGMSSVAWWGLVGVVLHDVHHPALCLEVFPCSCTIYMMYTIMWLSTIIIPPPMASRLSSTWWIASPSEPTRSSRIKNTLERKLGRSKLVSSYIANNLRAFVAWLLSSFDKASTCLSMTLDFIWVLVNGGFLSYRGHPRLISQVS